MKIAATIYEALTPLQRVAAAISALARDDNEEVERLKKTCPMKSYLATDDAYTGTMMNLMVTALAVESDLRGLALDFLSARARKEKGEAVDGILSEIASITRAWRLLSQELGIDHNELVQASAPHHRAVIVLAGHCEGEEDEGTVERYLKAMREIFA